MSNLKGTKMLAHQLRGLGEFFEPYADEIDALRAEVESERRLTSELRKTEAIQSATIRELRAHVEALREQIKEARFHLEWIANPAGNDICTPAEIATRGLAEIDAARAASQPPEGQKP